MKGTKRSYERLQRQGKQKVKCIDGPWKGETLLLTGYDTAIFTIQNQTGQYRYGKWYPHNG